MPPGVLRARLTAQLLSGARPRSALDVVRRILAVQAQDPRGARLAVRSRSTGVTATDVDAAFAGGELVVSWLNRGTLHLVLPEDYWWLHPLTVPQLTTGNASRLRQEGVSPEQADRGVDVVTRALQSEGPLTRPQLRDRLDDEGVPTARQALVHVLVAASIRGYVVRGPVVGGEQAFAWAPDWLGPPPAPIDRDEGLARLARRFLAGHGPADARDLAKWAGLPLGQARRGLAAIADEVVEVAAGSGTEPLFDVADRPRPRPLPPPRLLGSFDPLLHGWVDRTKVVGAYRQVVTNNGLFRPVALVDGCVVATWALSAGTVTITLLQPVDSRALAALRKDAGAVLRFLGLPHRDPVVAATVR